MSAVSERLYALRQALRLVGQRPGRFYLSVVLAAAAIALPLMVAAVALTALNAWKSAKVGPELSVFVKVGTAPGELEALRARLASSPGVAEVRVIPRDQALTELSTRSGLAAGTPDSRANPLPDTLVARFPLTVDPAAIDRAAAEARQWSNVDQVQSEIGWYRRLTALRHAGLTVTVGLLGLAAMLTLAAVIAASQMCVQLSSDEVRLLQLVGASPGFVRRPYAYVGALTLATGAAFAVGIAWLAIEVLAGRSAVLGALLSTAAVAPWVPIALVLGAGVVGALLGGIAARLQMRRALTE